MALTVTRKGGDFKKVVFDRISETLPGGLILDNTGYTAAVDGMIPAGTCVGVTVATGIGRIISDPAAPGAGVEIRGLTADEIPNEPNILTGVATGFTARVKALPANEQAKIAALRTALPKGTFY